MNIRTWTILPLLVFLGIAGWYGFGLMLNDDDRALPSQLIDRPVPDLALPPLREGDEIVKAADIVALAKRGPLLVNVFASWCLPCRAEHPLLMELQQQGVKLIGINQRDKPEDAKTFLKALGDPYTWIATDRDGRASIEWGVYGVPETFVIDRTGRIRHRHVGPMDRAVLDKTILPLLRSLAAS
ncbi:DsbE family thiol:disulfide interchange protein [Lacibacterium aquatile]|uniref:DsbE family thiol:disulfide interchange protein n=1 Tax=Lacibacterium aquatile TaxID=1168082 RepID=A0ABW5DWM6_9PROT